MINYHQLAKNVKKVLFGEIEVYSFNNRRLKFTLGTRPVKRKYISSKNGVVRNDVLQIEFFEKSFTSEDVLWDIGSHYGHYSILCASVAAGPDQVYSFEPDSFAASIQHKNIGLNEFESKIRLYDKAVSDVNGDANFHSKQGNANSNIVKRSDKLKSDNVVVVESVTLDSLADELPFPTFIKIDVEGAEIDVLSRADKLLKNPAVRFICELHPFAWKDYGVSYTQFTDILIKHNRRILLLDSTMNESDLPFYGTVIF
jgi:FkbM family methyltransferase